MKKLILLFTVTLSIQMTIAQPPEYFVDNWYLHSFSFGNQETFINTLGLTQGPTMIINGDYTLYGDSFCNSYHGNYEYFVSDPLGGNDLYRPRNIIRETENCETLEEMETHFFLPFIEERIADIYVMGSPGNEKQIVLQYNFGYQVYKNFPALNLSDISIKDLVIFPNPTQNKLIIHSAINDFESVSIVDIQGRIVMNSVKSNSKEIDVSSLKSGVYFIRILSSLGNITKKFIKN